MSDYINVSGSIFKGIPTGRITCFVGEPSVGKSYMHDYLRKTAKLRENKLKRILNEEL